MQEVHITHERTISNLSVAHQEGSQDHQEVLRVHIEEIDRLTKIVKELEEEIY